MSSRAEAVLTRLYVRPHEPSTVGQRRCEVRDETTELPLSIYGSSELSVRAAQVSPGTEHDGTMPKEQITPTPALTSNFNSAESHTLGQLCRTAPLESTQPIIADGLTLYHVGLVSPASFPLAGELRHRRGTARGGHPVGVEGEGFERFHCEAES